MGTFQVAIFKTKWWWDVEDGLPIFIRAVELKVLISVDCCHINLIHNHAGGVIFRAGDVIVVVVIIIIVIIVVRLVAVVVVDRVVPAVWSVICRRSRVWKGGLGVNEVGQHMQCGGDCCVAAIFALISAMN